MITAVAAVVAWISVGAFVASTAGYSRKDGKPISQMEEWFLILTMMLAWPLVLIITVLPRD